MPLAHYIKLKEGPVNKKKMFGPRFFPHAKYETWIGFGLQKSNANDDSFALLSHNNLVSFYRNTIRREK